MGPDNVRPVPEIARRPSPQPGAALWPALVERLFCSFTASPELTAKALLVHDAAEQVGIALTPSTAPGFGGSDPAPTPGSGKETVGT